MNIEVTKDDIDSLFDLLDPTVPLAKKNKRGAVKIKEDIKKEDSLPSTSEVSPSLRFTPPSKVETYEYSRILRDALPQVEIQSTIFTLMSAEKAIDEAGGIIISDPDISSENLKTLNDPRMGTIENDRRCATCYQMQEGCSGHMGVIILTEPVLNPFMIRYIVSVLNSVCDSCGFLKLTEEELRKNGILALSSHKRLTAVEKLSKERMCKRKLIRPGGGDIEPCLKNVVYLPKASLEDGKIKYKLPGDIDESFLETKEVLKILEAISPEDALLLGFEEGSHPKDMVLQALPVPPPCARPPIVRDGEPGPSDITRIYSSIVKDNNKLADLRNEGHTLDNSSEYQSKLKALEKNLAELFGTDTKRKIGHARPSRSIKLLLQGKGGAIRRFFQGKRTDRSGRAVLSTDPDIDFGMVGIPEYLTYSLLVDEDATQENIDRLQDLFEKGKVLAVHKNMGPGVTKRRLAVTKGDRDRIRISLGDMVTRTLQDGDWVIMNRNPSLSADSFMSARAIIRKDNPTIQFHMAYTDAMAADFDGDCLNVHRAGGTDACVHSEVENILNVGSCIISRQSNRPVIAVKYDAVTAMYKLTLPTTSLSYDRFQQLIDSMRFPTDIDSLFDRAKKVSLPPDSGRVAFSALLPKDFAYNEKGVTILNGILISGVIRETHIGGKHHTILQAIHSDYGKEKAAEFLTDIYRMANTYLMQTGFTMGIGDCETENTSITDLVKQEYKKAKEYVKAKGPPPVDDVSRIIRYEEEVNAKLYQPAASATKLVKDVFGEDNNIRTMITSGSKGGETHAIAISGVIGQQSVGMGRPGVDPILQRSIPYFKEGDTDPVSRGYIESSLVEGITPTDTHFYAQATRPSMVNRHINTAKSGAISQNLTKMLEDIMVFTDGSIVYPSGNTIQAVYGYNGFDPVKMEQVLTPFGDIPLFMNPLRTALRLNSTYGYNYA